ncbi:SDR family oxidoreductase [Steroidobacter agaridevorans]|uniref:SDR family oxidoreductase n=1 Tax=Steroidobacter agaridevorans TaxID=2695856 RepID=UPI001327B905|nr:SDR family oxidoreductase [Steroidobacter agaridevorans]GFE89255.1 oxidoreductase [Steroidobacter agaridevorans]
MDQKKIAVVTGAGTGIGRNAALALAKRNFVVVLAGRNLQTLNETASLAGGAETLAVPTDVTNPASVAQLFDKTKTTFGRVDVLFNNAGTSAPPVPFEQLTPEQWDAVVAVNLTGAFLVAQAAYRVMKDQTPQGGRIINNGSISAQVPRPNSAPYTATKHAITGLTKSLSLDGRKYNIACGQIDIGNAATSMVNKISTGVVQANGSLLAEPTMPVDHVGEAIAYMAGLPLETNVQFMTVMATAMPYIGRG